jgi:methyltransferase (TIGR00027 family)
MPRTDGDTWDLASGVGATATGVAAARSLASLGPNPLIKDPFAEPLVRAVGVDYFIKMALGQIEPDEDEVAPDPQILADAMAVRTKYFDDFLTSATDAGLRQAVILASGLDARAYRLGWPPGTTVFEVDQPQVIEFKERTLAELGVTPTAALHSVGIDLRRNWTRQLLLAGFDTKVPTAWIAEGLLAYLPPESQDRLFDEISRLSAPGSRIATDWLPDMESAFNNDRIRAFTASRRAEGLDIADPSELTYVGERNSVVEYLYDRGWHTSTVTVENQFVANGLTFDPDNAMIGLFGASFTSARLI